ncbi:hypothetical protein AtubIFM57258_006673 [Aspergillus tubingensis]|nr:hypothetical protein AtubIFM57258_006673 [Aspergillus tubingensis]
MTRGPINRPVRIAGCAGGNTDRWDAIKSFASDPSIDAIIGDWLSESNMVGTAAIKARDLTEENEQNRSKGAYAKEFLQCFEPAIADLSAHGMKLVVNAGASDTELLAIECQKLVQRNGHGNLRIAWIEGDNVTNILLEQRKKGDENYPIRLSGKSLSEVDPNFVFAQCYLGGWGIAKALAEGADIVICGRVSDASPVVGVAAWWHGWSENNYDELARALIAGHLIECSGYATGGNFTGFKSLLKAGKHLKLGFPIAEIEANGEFTIAKEKNTGGCVTVESLTSQLIYEIQGPWYLNSDVVADLTGVKLEQFAPEQVRVTGIVGMPPPPTTKLGFTTFGGYQAEFHAFMTGLDIDEKCKWTEEQIREAIGEDIHRFTQLRFHRIGSPSLDTTCQDHATVMFRVFAQTKDPEILRTDVPRGLFRWCMSTFLSSCPALTPSNDPRQVHAKPYYNYNTGLIPQSVLNHRVHLLATDPKKIITIDPPSVTQTYGTQPSHETENPVDISAFGETVKAPLGSVVYGRAGDKGANCNVGFYVKHQDEWDWLRTFLTTDKIKELLGPIEYSGNQIDRFEIPGVRVVHFLLHDHLDRGYNSSSSCDVLGKNTCEFLRSKTVDVPKVFLQRY